MWILRYQYIDETGSEIRVSCCLKKGTQYVVGRSVKSPLQIKGDKSISRKHVQLEVRQNSKLEVLNAGKLTKIGGDNVKMDQMLEFGADQSVALEMGAGPVKGTVTYEPAIWKIPHDLAITESLKNHLSLYDIQVTNSLTSKTSVQIIKEHQKSHGNCLFALVKKIPIMCEGFIGDFVSQFADTQIDFDAKWEQITLKNAPFLELQTKDAAFKGLNFVVTNQKTFAIYKSIIDAGSGNLWLCGDVSNLGTFIEKQIKSENVVILIHLIEEAPALASEQNNSMHIQEAKLLKNKARSLGFKTRDVNDIVDAVLKNDILSLLDRVPQEKALEENSAGGSIAGSQVLADIVADAPNLRNKRKRANRQIQPLNSLAFFGGGSSLSQKLEQVSTPAKEQNLELQEGLGVHTNPEVHPLSKKPREEKNTLHSAGNNSTTTFSETPIHQEDVQIGSEPLNHSAAHSVISKEDESTHTDERNKTLVNSAKDARTVTFPSIHKNELKSSRTLSNEAKVEGNISHADTEVQAIKRPRSLIQAFQEAKQHEVHRLKKNMADVGSEELTEEAINKLDNLASVEKVDLMRRPSEVPENSNQRILTNPQWARRKNFKKFVKLWPSHSSRSSPDNITDAVRNKAYLITRDYVSLCPYDGTRNNSADDGFGDACQQHAAAEQSNLTASPGNLALLGVEVENGPAFAFQSQRAANSQANSLFNETDNRRVEERSPERNQELFVVDEDDSQPQVACYSNNVSQVPSRLEDADQSLQPDERRVPRVASLRNTVQHESDDSDDEPQFRFQSRR
ncbi:Xrs2p [Lachancea thermotolerans CBS 6340]|uniref:KLTH0F16038p n=1 Tax=Lachancea thermotolerans (strain ATCC 56472 / CBS 6340 / NRRL Y-8284) TaxID=559295 RepID=C5DJF7_LACTC|nr:KLTH0F16038p [Lachancea thermotolerans CBS 6340]CAR24446.1 KLTH0F16038p [Lachancea thermotolerans CBS 6340]